MKKLFLPFLAIILMAACAQEQPQQATISGTVENPTSETLEIFYYKDFIANTQEKVEVTLDENNSFSATLPLTEGQMVYLRMPRLNVQLYLQPGAEVNVVADAANADAIPEVGGEQALESRFMVNYDPLQSQYNRMIVLNKAGEMTPVEFINYMDEVYQEKMDFLLSEEYQQLDADFVNHMQTNFLYEKYGLLLEYPRAYAQMNQEDELELPEGYYSFLEAEDLFSDEYTSSRAYISFMNNYMAYQRQNMEPQNEELSYYEAQYQLTKELFSGKSRDLMLSQVMMSLLNFADFQVAQELYANYQSVVNTPEYKQVVEEEYQTVLALAPGQPAPDFTLTNIDGEPVSLSDFEGKVVYLDFWASWCGPCMREMPHAKELKERLAGEEDLVYLYISVDTDEEAWRKTVAQHEITGVHVNVPGFGHEVPAGYNLKGVPTFYLIGRDGMIIDNRPPRPSSEKIDQVLLDALQQS
ncbi:MAG: TlpA disulfide reductase family protein [Bacteroidales bacterium]